MHTLWGLLASSYQLQGGGARHCCSPADHGMARSPSKDVHKFGGGPGDHVNRKLFLRVGSRDLASYPGPHAERGRGPGDTWQNSRMCSVSIIA